MKAQCQEMVSHMFQPSSENNRRAYLMLSNLVFCSMNFCNYGQKKVFFISSVFPNSIDLRFTVAKQSSDFNLSYLFRFSN